MHRFAYLLCSRAFTTIGQQTTNQNNYGHSKKSTCIRYKLVVCVI